MARRKFSNPRPEYSQADEAGFRRDVEQALNENEFVEVRIAGGVLYGENGVLKFKSAHGTVTTVAAL